MTCTAAWNQKAFRGRNDDGNETTATWKAAQNTNFSQIRDTNFRIRFEVQETAACAGSNKVWQLQYNKNSAGWNNVTGSSSNVRSSASANLADAANLTDQLTAGTGTFQGATGFDEVDGAAGGSSMDVSASGHAEAEFSIQIRSAEVAAGDTIQLRITDNGTAFAAYDQTPSITVSSGNVTVTPPTLSLTTTKFAPVIKLVVTPPTKALTTTTFAPTVTVGKIVTPPTVALVTTGYAPQVKLGVIPPTASLTTTRFAPVIKLGIVPGTISLTITAFAPTIGGSASAMPGTAALVLTTYAPTVSMASTDTQQPTGYRRRPQIIEPQRRQDVQAPRLACKFRLIDPEIEAGGTTTIGEAARFDMALLAGKPTGAARHDAGPLSLGLVGSSAVAGGGVAIGIAGPLGLTASVQMPLLGRKAIAEAEREQRERDSYELALVALIDQLCREDGEPCLTSKP